MSQQGDSLSAYWDEQRRMMSRRPRGRAELRETGLEAQPELVLPKLEPGPASPVGEGDPARLEELRDIEQGEALQQAAGPTEEQVAQAALLEPVIWLSEGQADLLRPGWIALLQDVLPEAGEPYEARLLRILDSRTQRGARGGSWEQVLCLWQRLDTGACFRQIAERMSTESEL